ncbi:MAG: NAD(P)-dependent glycerol-3-phosphate dehydrogenase, partial [Betaproteobacteria bacterium]|nr:NAD(P)-dependent glycerol-3-phosphate dehydrogenase [Betaproteobacteria bacterium]
MRTRVAVLGGGAWGSALAVHLAARSHAAPRVLLYLRSSERAAELVAARENARYLPGIALPASIDVTSHIADARHADILIAATPVAELVALIDALAAAQVAAPLALACKGFVADPGSPAGCALAHEIVARRWSHPVGAISGPSFAIEVARGLPTALVAAAGDPAFAHSLAALLRGDALRCYPSDDLPGVEVGGAVKNVLAIAAGASDGLGFGHNARAALITRGLAECGRLSAALGGKRETLMGLAGLGDLVLTCTGDLSRNRRVGLALARGESLPAI